MTETYGTIAAFKTYHTERGNATSISGIADDDITRSLLVASEWVDNVYRNMWSGEKVGQRDQIRDWPRSSAYDVNNDIIDYTTVPAEVERATYEAALRQATTAGSLTLDWTPNKYNRVSVDGAVSVEYRTFAEASDTQTRFNIIDHILSVLLSGTSNLSSLSGRVARV